MFITKKKLEALLESARCDVWKEFENQKLYDRVNNLEREVEHLKFRVECLEHPNDRVKVSEKDCAVTCTTTNA